MCKTLDYILALSYFQEHVKTTDILNVFSTDHLQGFCTFSFKFNLPKDNGIWKLNNSLEFNETLEE